MGRDVKLGACGVCGARMRSLKRRIGTPPIPSHPIPSHPHMGEVRSGRMDFVAYLLG
jgi:hypothetical protein